MINPFKPDTAKKLAADVDRARAAHTKLAERLTAAEVIVTERRAAAQCLARDGADDVDLDAAEAQLRAAIDRTATLTSALAETAAQVAALEEAIAKAADKKLRSETAAAIEVLAREMTEAGAAFNAGAARLAETSRRVAAIVLEGHGLQAFAMNAGAEVPAAVAMIVEVLHNRVRATLAGTAPAALPKPDIPAPLISAPAPETKRLWLTRHARWIDASGQNRIGERYSDQDLTPSAAARALASGAAVPLTDPRRRQLKGQPGPHGPRFPTASECEDLDAPAPSTAEPVVHSAFVPLDRGPVRTGTIRAAREEAAS